MREKIDAAVTALRDKGLEPGGIVLGLVGRRALLGDLGDCRGHECCGCYVESYAGVPVTVLDDKVDDYLAIELKA